VLEHLLVETRDEFAETALANLGSAVATRRRKEGEEDEHEGDET